MHVAGANLKTVGVFLDHREIARIHHFGDHRQTCFRARFRKETKPLFAQPLKTIWRSARLKRATAQNFRA